jgi:hypothetical protein
MMGFVFIGIFASWLADKTGTIKLYGLSSSPIK